MYFALGSSINVPPHYAISEALTLDEPFIEVQDGGSVEKGATDSVADTLSYDQMPDLGGKGGSDESHGDNTEANEGSVASKKGIRV